MQKRSYTLLMGLLATVVALATPITKEQAQQTAMQFLSGSHRHGMPRNIESVHLAATKHYRSVQDQQLPCYYVFNVGGDGGYVVVGGDDRMPEVLGYADSGTFDADQMPDNMRAWMEEYVRQAEWLCRHPEAAAPRKVVTGGNISPLLGATEWNQRSPFNDLCPMDGSMRSLTGCVATAMAQIMFYYQWPAQTTAEIPGYTTRTRKLTVDPVPAGTAFAWADMLPQYTSSATDNQKKAVARLVLACGTSVNMNYTASESGAYGGNVPNALATYFDYDDDATYEERVNYRLAAWSQKVYDELAAGRPVYYDGSSAEGGHAFIVDGYGGDDFFHVNWGWGGSNNDYFLLSLLDAEHTATSADDFNYGQAAIFGLQKNSDVERDDYAMTTTSFSVYGESTLTRSTTSDNFQTMVNANYRNYNNQTLTFDYAIGLFDTSNQLLSVVSDVDQTAELKKNYGYSSIITNIAFGAGIASGTFMLKPISRVHGSTQWQVNKGADNEAITVVISDNSASLIAPTINLDCSLSTKGRTEVGSPCIVEATFTNNGTFFNKEIFFFVDGDMAGGHQLELEGGQTTTVDFTFKPSSTGTKRFSVCRRGNYNSQKQDYDYITLASGSVTINAAPSANLTLQSSVENAHSGTVNDSKAVISVEAINNDTKTYNNIVFVQLYKLLDDGSNMGNLVSTKEQDVEIEAGATGTAQLTFTNLQDGGNYFCYVGYMSEGRRMSKYGGSFTVEIPKDGTVDYAFAEGWNWISVSTLGNDYSTFRFLQPIEDDVERLLSQTQETINDGEFGMVGNLTELSPTAGYKLKMSANATYSWTGPRTSVNTPILLKKGWNWIGYLPLVALEASTALENLRPAVGDRIVHQDGFAEFDGTTWQGDFTMQPGEGYIYLAANDAQLVYSSQTTPASSRGEAFDEGQPYSPWQYDSHAYPDNLIIVAQLDDASLPPSMTPRQQYAVGAFVGEECRGVGRVVGDMLFITVHGTSATNETVTFQAYDSMTDDVLSIIEDISFDVQCAGSLSQPVMLHVATPTDIVLQRETERSCAVYTLNGRRTDCLRRGLNIVVGTDGKARKVVMR